MARETRNSMVLVSRVTENGRVIREEWAANDAAWMAVLIPAFAFALVVLIVGLSS